MPLSSGPLPHLTTTSIATTSTNRLRVRFQFSHSANVVFCPGTVLLFEEEPFKKSANANNFLFARTTALIVPRANFVKSSRGFFLLLTNQQVFLLHYFYRINVFVWLFQEKLGTSVSLPRLWSLEKIVKHNWQDSSKPWLLKLKRIMDCMTKQTRITH